MAPDSAIVNDVNAELMTMYEVIRDHAEELINTLKSLIVTKESFYEIRARDRDPVTFSELSAVSRAARTIYLNRTGFNGLYRVNSRNEFNVPWGQYRNPKVCDEELILAVSEYFKTNDIEFRCEDFLNTIEMAQANDFIYADPPYAPLDDASSTFTSYTREGFTYSNLVDLRDSLDEAHKRGANWLLSNVKSRATTLLFPETEYRVMDVQVTRPINSNVNGRGPVPEILVTTLEASRNS